ncbi:MAG TPA: hypothetical protein VHA52_08810 [Candidatus Babeliaceae bacterium]|nr:hypothetical protein [Candidatus Babeliaceae bacterium]
MTSSTSSITKHPVGHVTDSKEIPNQTSPVSDDNESKYTGPITRQRTKQLSPTTASSLIKLGCEVQEFPMLGVTFLLNAPQQVRDSLIPKKAGELTSSSSEKWENIRRILSDSDSDESVSPKKIRKIRDAVLSSSSSSDLDVSEDEKSENILPPEPMALASRRVSLPKAVHPPES